MARRTYTEEFRIEAVKQVTENGYEIADTAHRLGVHPDSLRAWIKRLESPEAIEKNKAVESSNAEIKKLQKEKELKPIMIWNVLLLMMSPWTVRLSPGCFKTDFRLSRYWERRIRVLRVLLFLRTYGPLLFLWIYVSLDLTGWRLPEKFLRNPLRHR